MKLRIATIILALLDAIACALGVYAAFMPGSDKAAADLDVATGVVIALLYAMTGLPALVLALRGKAPRIALTLALAFPAAFACMFILVSAGFS